jgi:hypothetical protein
MSKNGRGDARGAIKTEREFYRREELRRKRGGRRTNKGVSVAPTSEEQTCNQPNNDSSPSSGGAKS